MKKIYIRCTLGIAFLISLIIIDAQIKFYSGEYRGVSISTQRKVTISDSLGTCAYMDTIGKLIIIDSFRTIRTLFDALVTTQKENREYREILDSIMRQRIRVRQL